MKCEQYQNRTKFDLKFIPLFFQIKYDQFGTMKMFAVLLFA